MIDVFVAGIRFAPRADVPPQVTVEWILRRDHSDVRCMRRETARGIELSVTFCGLLVAACVASTLAHAATWASSRRESWQAAGFELLSAAA